MELASHFDGAGSFSVKANGSNWDATASGGVSGSQTITLSRGATFAYGMHKVSNWNQGKTQIERGGMGVIGTVDDNLMNY